MDTVQKTPSDRYIQYYDASENPTGNLVNDRYLDGVVEKMSQASVHGDFTSVTPYDRRHELSIMHHGEETFWNYYNKLAYKLTGALGDHMALYPLNYSNSCYNTAVERLYDSLRGNIDLSIDLAQYKQTARTAGSLAETIEKLGSDLKKVTSRYGKGKAAFKAASSLWLQWQYGVKPTVSTLHDLLIGITTSEGQLIRVKGSASEKSINHDVFNTLTDYNRTNKVFFKARINASYKLNASQVTDVAQLTSLNPISIGWELVPFSFCVDWLIDIGGFIRSTETALLHGGNFVAGYAQESALVLCNSSASISTRQNHNYRERHSQASLRISKYKRVILNGTPFPRLPPVNLQMGWQRLTSAAALVSNLLPDSFREGGRRIKIKAIK